MGYVPVLVDDTVVVSDSFAIILKYIEENVSPGAKLPWAQYHIRKGFVALEKLLNEFSGKYATGDEIFLADIYILHPSSVMLSQGSALI
ncbi:hypothetical protein RJ639_020671 [Escallonia herrerae]|uniref:Glutathione S-transferase n=1 Tax=Escallonia herrerae TaxID=1293975 RepID=A0AA89AFU5_9ASTE|nr:hypothetical protein RJ639_020671 [Escallonia herrerae]